MSSSRKTSVGRRATESAVEQPDAPWDSTTVPRQRSPCGSSRPFGVIFSFLKGGTGEGVEKQRTLIRRRR